MSRTDDALDAEEKRYRLLNPTHIVYKTTIVVWSSGNPCGSDIKDLAFDVADGGSVITMQETEYMSYNQAWRDEDFRKDVEKLFVDREEKPKEETIQDWDDAQGESLW